jgi:uroporphyrinogen decarboxylase
MLTPRERVLCALNHEEPDRVPVFFGTSGVTSILSPAYAQLRAYLGMPPVEEHVISRTFQYARLDEDIMVRCGSDGRPLIPRAAPSSLRREISATSFADEWGIVWEMQPGSLYYEIAQSPLREASLDDLDRYPWPATGHPARFEGLGDEARAIQAAGYAVVALTGVSPFEQIGLLRGLDAWLLDLAADPDFAQALLTRVTDLMLEGVSRLLDEAGQHIDVLLMGDDLGSQQAPLISPAMYRKLVKPHHARLAALIKSKSKAKIFCHSDGNVYPLIGDLIDVGIDILNPVQVSAKDMGDTARLKRDFGKRLSFSGGVDTGWVLPHGTPAEVRQEVRRRIRDLGPGGGYILSAVHCIQPDVPAENVCAMFDEARLAGRYPLDI